MKITDKAVEAAWRVGRNFTVPVSKREVRAILETALPHLSQGSDKKVFEWRGRAYFYERNDRRPWGEYWKFIGSAALSPAPVGVTDWEEPPLTCPHIDAAIESGDLSEAVKAELAAIKDINSQLRHGTWALKAALPHLSTEVESVKTTDEAVEAEFQRWWKASKYCQVILPQPHLEQYARDGFRAAVNAFAPHEPALTACQQEVERLLTLNAERIIAEKDAEIERTNVSWNNTSEMLGTALARNAELVKALKFYADVSKYPAPLTGGMGDLWLDCGDRARAALGGQSDE